MIVQNIIHHYTTQRFIFLEMWGNLEVTQEILPLWRVYSESSLLKKCQNKVTNYTRKKWLSSFNRPLMHPSAFETSSVGHFLKADDIVVSERSILGLACIIGFGMFHCALFTDASLDALWAGWLSVWQPCCIQQCHKCQYSVHRHTARWSVTLCLKPGGAFWLASWLSTHIQRLLPRHRCTSLNVTGRRCPLIEPVCGGCFVWHWKRGRGTVGWE